jgi:para-nitrobenzyl esterase
VQIDVTGGVIRGETVEDLTIFRGIPFASLPVRFGAPQPVEPWSGVREATTFGPPPPQSGVFGTDATTDGNEDWLTANVWTLDPAGTMPVMVWVQGGAYMFGTSGTRTTTAATSRSMASWS